MLPRSWLLCWILYCISRWHLSFAPVSTNRMHYDGRFISRFGWAACYMHLQYQMSYHTYEESVYMIIWASGYLKCIMHSHTYKSIFCQVDDYILYNCSFALNNGTSISSNYARVTFADPLLEKYTLHLESEIFALEKRRRHVCKRLDDQGHHASRRVGLIIDGRYWLWVWQARFFSTYAHIYRMAFWSWRSRICHFKRYDDPIIITLNARSVINQARLIVETCKS